MDVYLEKYLILLTAISAEIGRLSVLAELGAGMSAKESHDLLERLESAAQKAEESGK